MYQDDSDIEAGNRIYQLYKYHAPQDKKEDDRKFDFVCALTKDSGITSHMAGIIFETIERVVADARV